LAHACGTWQGRRIVSNLQSLNDAGAIEADARLAVVEGREAEAIAQLRAAAAMYLQAGNEAAAGRALELSRRLPGHHGNEPVPVQLALDWGDLALTALEHNRLSEFERWMRLALAALQPQDPGSAIRLVREATALATARPVAGPLETIRRIASSEIGAGAGARIVSSVLLYADDLREEAKALSRALGERGIQSLGPYATTDASAKEVSADVDALIVVVQRAALEPLNRALEPLRSAIGGQLLIPLAVHDGELPEGWTSLADGTEAAATRCALRLRDASAIDFGGLTAFAFEELAVQLLAVMGMPSEPAAHREFDLVGEAPEGLIGGRVPPGRWLVEVKHATRPLGIRTISDLVERLGEHAPGARLLLVTSSRLSAPARDFLRRPDLKRRVEVLEGPELRAILQQAPEVRERFIR
jgi:hypothetical protein